jgi:hypothetical protein
MTDDPFGESVVRSGTVSIMVRLTTDHSDRSAWCACRPRINGCQLAAKLLIGDATSTQTGAGSWTRGRAAADL